MDEVWYIRWMKGIVVWWFSRTKEESPDKLPFQDRAPPVQDTQSRRDEAWYIRLRNGIAAWWFSRTKEESPDKLPFRDRAPPVQRDTYSGNRLTLQLFSLGSSLTLLPYIGPGGLLKDPTFTSDYRWWVNVVFPTWWFLVCMGVPCTMWGRWAIEVQYARLSTHLGMLGITLLVIMFSHWMLALEATWVTGALLISATGFFVVFWLRCCFMGDI